MPDRRVGTGLRYVQDLKISRDTDALIRMLASPSFAGSRSSVRASAAQALGRLGDRSAGPALMQALDDPDDRIRFYAADALVELPYIAAGPRLIDCLEDDTALPD
jgi:HEAT repeat protein